MYQIELYSTLAYLIIISFIIYIIKHIVEHRYLKKDEHEALRIRLSVMNNGEDEYLTTTARHAIITIKLMLFKLVYIPLSLFILTMLFNGKQLPLNIHWLVYYLISIVLISFTHQGIKQWLGKRK